jgi:predicted dehydrogenase
MKAALLGLAHPHTAPLLATLQYLPEISGICLWDPEAGPDSHRAEFTGPKVVQWTTDLDAVLRQPDLIFAIVCVPTAQAAALARRVLLAGKHLLAEKPVALSSAEIAELEELARRLGLVASVLYPRRFHPCMVAAKALIGSGELGRLHTAEARFLTTQVRFRSPDSWLFRRAQSGGGILLWLGCHSLDLLSYLTGDEIAAVGAQLATRSDADIEVEDTAALTLRFRSGAVGTLVAGYTLAYSGGGYLNRSGNDSYVGINCAHGRVVWPDLEPRLQVESPPQGDRPAVRDETFLVPSSPCYSGFGGEIFFRQFIAAVSGGGEPPTILGDAVRTARIVEAAELSSRSGQFIVTP